MQHFSKLISTSATTAFVAAGLVLAACGGNAPKAATTGSGGGGVTANATASVAHFCRDYTAADDAYGQTLGDVTDPEFAVFLSSLAQAQAEAPAAVKSDVTTMLNDAKRAKAGANGIDLTAPSARVSAWADSNCADSGSDDNATNSTSPDTSPNASSAPSPDGGSSTAFCSDALSATYAVAGLVTQVSSLDSSSPSTSDWQTAETKVKGVLNEAPSTILPDGWDGAASGSVSVHQLWSTLADDLDSIVNDGYDYANVNAEMDNTNVQTATQKVCSGAGTSPAASSSSSPASSSPAASDVTLASFCSSLNNFIAGLYSSTTNAPLSGDFISQSDLSGDLSQTNTFISEDQSVGADAEEDSITDGSSATEPSDGLNQLAQDIQAAQSASSDAADQITADAAINADTIPLQGDTVGKCPDTNSTP